MDNRYKIIVSNKKIYKEIELSSDSRVVRIGTTKNCHERFGKEFFFEDFEIEVENDRNNWKISCSDKIYFISDGVTKLYSKELQHGDDIIVKYESSKQEVFKLSFMLDFDFEKKEYDRVIDISGIDAIQIGGHNRCELFLKDELIGNDTVTVSKKNGTYQIVDNHSKYGVYVNTEKVKNSAKIVDFDFFSIIGYSFYLKYGKLYTDSHNGIVISSLPYEDTKEQTSTLSYPKFNRNTRIKPVISSEKIEVLDPPSLMEKPKSNLVMSLVPALGMLGVTVLLRGVMGGGGMFVLFSVCTMGMGIVTSIFSFINNRKEYKRKSKERVEKYNVYINNKRTEIIKLRREELETLEEMYYSLPRELEMVRDFSGDLFNRNFGDDDFLHVRLGTGSVISQQPVENKKQEKFETADEMANMPEQLAQEFKMIGHAPVVADFARAGAIGVIGLTGQLYSIMKNIILDLCIRHYYKDVKILIVVDPEKDKLIQWTRMLPHVFNDDLDIRNIICEDESKNVLFEYLFKELSARETNKITAPNFVVLVFDEMGIKSHPISRYIQNADTYGFTFVFFENEKEMLPHGCKKIIMLNKNDSTGTIIDSSDSSDTLDFSYETADDMKATETAIKLAPIYCEEVSLESTLTKNISLYELLHILSVDDLDLAGRWQSSVVYKSMAAPLGVRTKNEIVCLDLHEKAHGPHGLVAGTTGSGKSEILQSYILSMATLFHPYEVSFVIIDFKGGGMVNQFKDLPHLVGAITNIDGREIDRSLLSIKAELKKRQGLFAQCNVNHIDKYIQKFKSGEVTYPLPHLILIVDEFAELKAEQPEFMKELISAARIGRSLGVHLILATQKPSGVVDDQIWSNSKFKMCLKVQNKQDSNEVLKSPLAAEIKEPGRAYLQVGNNEIFELFQSAYSGGSAKMEAGGQTKEYSLSTLSLSGKRKVVYSQKKNKTEGNVVTQLDDIVQYVSNYCCSRNIRKLPDICLPPLAETIAFPADVPSEKKDMNIRAALGMFDDPENQYQGETQIDMTADNLMIIGSAQFGKTNLLQSLIRSLTSRYSPEEINLFILDFGSMVLKTFESLQHVGGVVTSSEDEKLKNFFKLIYGEIASRKERLVSVGVSSFASYKEAGYTDIPQIVILVDNLTALKELYLNDDDSLLGICRDGLTVGISVIVANSQTSGIGYKYLANFSARIVLFCNDSSEYSSMFDQCRLRPREVPGRCIIKRDKKLYECQTYLAFTGEKEIDRVKDMKAYIETQNAAYPDQKARYIPEIPKVLTDIYAEKQFGFFAKKAYNSVVGLDFSSVNPVVFDLNKLGVLAVTGREKAGNGNFVRQIVYSLEKRKSAEHVEVIIIDDVTKKFSSLQSLDIVTKYTIDVGATEEILTKWSDELTRRYALLMEGSDSCLEDVPLLLLIIQNQDVLQEISSKKELMDKYKAIITKYKAMKICIIVSSLANEVIPYSGTEPAKMIKEARHLVVFEDISNVKVLDIPFATVKEFKKPIELGDAYYIRGNETIKMKTTLHTDKSC